MADDGAAVDSGNHRQHGGRVVMMEIIIDNVVWFVAGRRLNASD